MSKLALVGTAWRPAGAHALRKAHGVHLLIPRRFESLSAPETHGKQGITLPSTLRSVDSIEVPATEMVLDLKQIVSTHIVELDTHTLDTAVERVEKSIWQIGSQ